MTKALILGDVHGKFEQMNRIVEKDAPDVVIQVGDLGFYPKYAFNPTLNSKSMYFCEGNHEELNTLFRLPEGRVTDNITHMRRGTVHKIGDSTVLFIGGARSIDYMFRVAGEDYFPNLEVPSIDDRETIFKNIKDVAIDVVISHAAPEYFYLEGLSDFFDPTRYLLNDVFEAVKPARWFFGHYHVGAAGIKDGCEWQCLNRIDNSKGRVMIDL